MLQLHASVEESVPPRPTHRSMCSFLQWRRKSKIQESLLQELERRNATTQRAVAVKTESDLRRVVHDGRALVRNWPSSSASSSMLPMTGKNRRNVGRRSPSEPASTKADNTIKYCCSNREGKGSAAGNDAGNRRRSPTDAQAVYATVTREEDQLYSHQPPRIGMIGCQAQQVGRNLQTNTPPDERAPPWRAKKSVLERRKNNSELATPGRQQSSGWFWGAGGYDTGDGGDGGACDIGIAAPGEGTMAAYWRKPSAAAGKSPASGTAIAQDAVKYADGSTTRQNCSSARQASFGEGAATESPSYSDEHALVGETCKTSSNSHNNSRLFISVASAKAAVRSASNRAAELSHLLREGNNPPREECLAKAESAVRAAESAISCANERLFQLELMAASEFAAQEAHGGIDDSQSICTGDGKQPSKQRPGDSTTTSSARSSSSLSAHIDELTEQLRLAQGLQAVSANARARLSRRFSLEAIAAVRLQALVRGVVSRWRERRREATAVANRGNTTYTKVSSASAPLDFSLSRGTDVQHEAVGNAGLEQGDAHVGTAVPRTEELWWTPAEAAGADAMGESESALLTAVVKLQAIVRSRLARSQTIAAVNARFAEHFDEEYQLPFYVCSETNTSQWNKPFGFASGGGERDSSHPLVHGVSTTALLEANSADSFSSLAERAEETEEMGPVSLKAVVKLQAIVRSRIARSKTFAAVNARFEEHFDEEHQHPFYVCIETNSSQWNQPFGFGWTRGATRQGRLILEGEDEGAVSNDCGGTTDGSAGGQARCGTSDEKEAAVTIIQCAVRGARARAQLAEKIILASL